MQKEFLFGAQLDCKYFYQFLMKVNEKVPKSYPCSNRSD